MGRGPVLGQVDPHALVHRKLLQEGLDLRLLVEVGSNGIAPWSYATVIDGLEAALHVYAQSAHETTLDVRVMRGTQWLDFEYFFVR
ncbi:MAG: hypothetical protein AAGF11_55625 [Myxococcota bacterium]